MAQKKITDLTALTSADSTDVIEIVDVSANTNKKVTVAGLAAGHTHTTNQLTIPTFRKVQSSGSSSRTGMTGMTWTQIPDGYSYTNSTSATQTVHITGSIMIHMTDSTSVCNAALFVGTTKISNEIYHNLGTTWMRYGLEGRTTVAAGATVTFSWGVKTETADGKFLEVANNTTTDAGRWEPTLQGIAVN